MNIVTFMALTIYFMSKKGISCLCHMDLNNFTMGVELVEEG